MEDGQSMKEKDGHFPNCQDASDIQETPAEKNRHDLENFF